MPRVPVRELPLMGDSEEKKSRAVRVTPVATFIITMGKGVSIYVVVPPRNIG